MFELFPTNDVFLKKITNKVEKNKTQSMSMNFII